MLILLFIVFGSVSVSAAEKYPYSPKQVRCMIENVWHEARNEPKRGWLGVMFVTLHRVNDSRFPNSICKVVYQPAQFSWTEDDIQNNIVTKSQYQKKRYKEIHYFVHYVLANIEHMDDPTLGADHYHTIDLAPHRGRWRHRMKRVTTIGRHHFYRSAKTTYTTTHTTR